MSSCLRKHAVDIDILITSRNGDRKIMQSVRTTSRPLRIRKWNLSYTKVISIDKIQAGFISTMSQGFERDGKCRANRPTYSFL